MKLGKLTGGLLAVALMFGVAGMLAVAAEGDAKEAPAFTLKDLNGNDVSLSDFEGKIVVLEWINFKCPFVVRHYNEKTHVSIAADYKDKGVVYLAIDSSYDNTVAENKRWVERYSIPYPILVDQSGEVGKAYGARTTPHMYVIHEGKIVYNGAIDCDPRGSKDVAERDHYVRKALDEIIAGTPVSTPTTRPYGCTVKYAN